MLLFCYLYHLTADHQSILDKEYGPGKGLEK